MICFQENNYNKRDSKPNGGYKKDDYEYERERNNEDKQRMLKNVKFEIFLLLHICIIELSINVNL